MSRGYEIHVYCKTEEEKERYKQAAERDKRALSSWMRAAAEEKLQRDYKPYPEGYPEVSQIKDGQEI